jgi:hypothetical protein
VSTPAVLITGTATMFADPVSVVSALVPLPFVAFTRHVIVCPTSPLTAVYVSLVLAVPDVVWTVVEPSRFHVYV